MEEKENVKHDSCNHDERCDECHKCSKCNPKDECKRKKSKFRASCHEMLRPKCPEPHKCPPGCKDCRKEQLVCQSHGDQGGQEQGNQEQTLWQSHGDQGGQAQGDQEQNQTIGDQEQVLTIGDSQQSQSLGDQQQEQNLYQTHGDQGGQAQGDQEQNQAQSHGDQDQQQTLGDQDQNQTQSHGNQEQTLGEQIQEQSHGDQTLGDQIIRGHTNISPLNNTQRIDTNVSGVTVNLTTNCQSDVVCSSCKEKHHQEKKKCDEKDHCETCCKCSLCSLLRKVQMLQASSEDNGVNIILTFPIAANPVEDQEITFIDHCKTVTFKDSDQVETNPRTTIPLGNISGISVSNTASTEEFFNALIEYAYSCGNKNDHDVCECGKKLNKCKHEISGDLEAAAKFGLAVNLFIAGQTDPTENLYVLNVCDCLVFLVDDLTDPTNISIITICAINGYVIP
ncbi:hypothetical protein [Metabacillus halosaccharovorans]|uniref:hypothetical protein n=1 Tax=Metabacillus halosaccharovorans TaxID=930124 RepID=UPI001C1F75F5|nr:hypothetical protein [Metabacillus halosaccharovorans]MBU7595309.1 DUF4175 domain-containing protein [Metabacillus halosaccharovorans]